jgi:hypothetical protein
MYYSDIVMAYYMKVRVYWVLLPETCTDQRQLPELWDVFHITHQCRRKLRQQMVSVVKVMPLFWSNVLRRVLVPNIGCYFWILKIFVYFKSLQFRKAPYCQCHPLAVHSRHSYESVSCTESYCFHHNILYITHPSVQYYVIQEHTFLTV